MTSHSASKLKSSSQNALLVAAGISLSRMVGFIREWFFARYFGNTDAADAFKAALKIPNLLQNLFGEGALSSSFIPVYAMLLASDRKDEARRLARVVGSILVLLMSLLVLVGMAATPYLINLIAPGFKGDKRDLTISLVRIFFPGIGILVLSAWCLGILNSHRRFFLPYAAPVLWNIPMIGALILFGGKSELYQLAEYVAWGLVIGSLLQLLVQLPIALQLAGQFRFQIETASANVRTVIRNFLPSVASRGVNQLSGYIDVILAGFLPSGAVAALAYAQNLYLLPISLFGTAISSAELPEMSSQLEIGEDLQKALRARLNDALQRVAFFVVPSAAAFLVLGNSMVSMLYQGGKFTAADARFVWMVLAGSTVGLLAACLGRIYSSTFWALRDTRTPLRFSILRVLLTTGLGWLLAFPVPRWLDIPARMGLAGLTISAGFAAWIEFLMLRSALNRRIGKSGLPFSTMSRLWMIAAIAAGLAYLVKLQTASLPPIPAGLATLSVYGIVYLGLAVVMNVPQAQKMLQNIRQRLS